MTKRTTAAALSLAGLLALTQYEGFTSTPVVPVEGDVLTIGFGHTQGVKPSDEVTVKEALALLGKDTAVAVRAVNMNVKVELTQPQFDALVSLVYNIGPGAFKNSTLLRCLNAGDYECVYKQWMRWKYVNGRPVKGLENRRARELSIFRGLTPLTSPSGDMYYGNGDSVLARELLQEQMRGPDEATTGGGGRV